MLAGLLTKWGYQAEMVHTGTDAQRELLKADAPQLAILDWVMPGKDGIEVIKEVRAAQRQSYTYILLLTSKGEQGDILQGLDAGADDYLKKPFDGPELRARLRVGARILGLEHRLVSALETTEHHTTHDLLTGLLNRTSIVELLNREASRCERAGQKLSVLLANIDHFKAINDTYGHTVGDQVIKQLAQKMGSPLRPHDSVGRFGGEEFLLLAPNCALSQALVVADRLRTRVAKDKFTVGQSAIAVTVSVGVSCVGAKGTTRDVELALKEADLAVHAAKKNGRNRVESSVASDAGAERSSLGAGGEKPESVFAPLKAGHSAS
jgi:diguanylate cyclase (GGDEF)-like protein